MPADNTDLKSHLLALERILQLLITSSGDGGAKFLNKLRSDSSRRHVPGINEDDFEGTKTCIEQFVHRMEFLENNATAK